MIKILINATASDIVLKDVGQTVPASGQLTIDPSDFDKYQRSSNVVTQISNGNLIVNDGVKNLSIKLGLALILDSDQRSKNVVRVSKSSSEQADYSTLKEALASITDASSTNRYVIQMTPGIYSEDNPVVMKEYVHIVGTGGPRLTQITPSTPSLDLFTGAHNVFMNGLYLHGVTGSGKYLINLGASSIANSILNITNCRFGSTHSILKSTAGSLDNHVYIHDCLIAHGDAFTNGFLANTTGAGKSKIHLIDMIGEKFGSAPDYVGYATGNGCEVEVVGCDMDTNFVSPSGVGFKVDNGAKIHMSGVTLEGFSKAIQTVNSGSEPHLHCSAVKIESCTTDVEVNHTSTHGSFIGVASRSKIVNAAPTTFVLSYTDPDNANFNNTGMLITKGLSPELTTTATSNSTLQLTRFDTHTQVFTGSTSGQIVKLPDATTFTKTGHLYEVWNFSSVDVSLRDFGNNILATIKPNGHTLIVLRDISTSSGLWGLTYTVDNGNVFGAQIYYQEQNAETSNNSTTTWANKITLTTPSLPLGDYLVQYQFNWRSAKANRQLEFRIQIGGADVDTGEPFTGSASDRQLISGFRRVQSISGIQTFTLDFRVGGSRTTVYLYNARMFVWRIS